MLLPYNDDLRLLRQPRLFYICLMPESISEINNLLQQYFDKVLVLTVPRFKDRQEKVKERLKGIDFEFFYGTDKNDIDDNFINDNYLFEKENTLEMRQYSPLNNGEIACSLSHRNIYQAIVDNGWKRVLIFEDDVVPEFENLPRITDTLKELPEDWELFYLGYLKNEQVTIGKRLKQFWYKIMGQFGLSRIPVAMIKRSLPQKFSPSLLKAGFHDCTHAYAISEAGAKKMIVTQTPVKYRADNLLSALILKGELNAFISKSYLFSQEVFSDKNGKSYIR